MTSEIAKYLKTLRGAKPMVLSLTNFVTMDFVANSLLAVGAVPIMSICDTEFEELVQIAHCVYLNIGTLDQQFVSRCKIAAEIAKKYKKPIVLDPVGAGCTKLRSCAAAELLPYAAVLRGNASEIIALSGEVVSTTFGVESTATTETAKAAALEIAARHRCTVVVSGAVDFITDGVREELVYEGSPLMTLVTGMGCAFAAVIGAFTSVSADLFQSSAAATRYFGICGKLAADSAQGPSAFKEKFIDNLYSFERVFDDSAK